MRKFSLTLLPALLATSSAVQAECDPALGHRIFESKCATCHVAHAGAADTTGPNLYGVFGRKSASRPGFGYSPGMRALGITWTTESLGKYLTDPQAMVPATYMAFTGLKRNDDRSALICFLNGLTGGAP